MSDPTEQIVLPPVRPNCCHLALAVSVAVALLFVAIIVLPCGPSHHVEPEEFPKVIKSEYVPSLKDEPKKLSVAVEQEGGQQTPDGWTAELGELIRLKATGSASDWNWDSPEIDGGRALIADGNRACFFSGRTPGTFFFTLAGRDEDELLQTRHVVIIGQRPAPPPGPGPVPPVPVPVPVSEKRCVLIVYESKAVTPAESRTYTNLRDGTAAAYLKSKGHMLDICDQNKLPASKYAPFGKLPELLIFDAANPAVPLFRGEMPATADNVIEAVRKTGG